jgi:hypothetical protein
MSFMRRIIAAFGVALGASGPAEAIVINDPAGLPRMLEIGAPHESVARLRIDDAGLWCSASLIAPTTVLTAKHCVDDGAGGVLSAARFDVELTAGDGALQAARQVTGIHAFGSTAGFDLLDGTDLALMSFLDPVLDRDPLRLFAEDPTGREALAVGYGGFGLGSTGSQPADGRRRGAANVVDAYGPAYGGGGAAIPGSADILSTDFDDPSGLSNTLGPIGSAAAMLPDEGTTAPGDSGGPLLLALGAEWVIAGVLSGGTTADSVYGDVSWWTGVFEPGARAFLEAAGAEYVARVPLPAAGPLLGAALLALVAACRGRPGLTGRG